MPKNNFTDHFGVKDYFHSRKNVINFLCHTAVLLALLFASGCGDISSSARTGEMRIAINPWPGYSVMYLADELGYFRDEGLNVRLVELASLADTRRVFENGQADLVCCTLVEVLMMNEAARRDAIQCVGVFDYSNGSDMLLATSKISSVKDLRGKRIGLEPESVDGLSVYLALKSVGLSIADVTLVPLAQAEMVTALKKGLVDAVQSYPPGSDDVEQIPGVHAVWDSSHAPETILDVLGTNSDLLVKQPDSIRGVLKAYKRAQDFHRQFPKESMQILTRRCRLSERELIRFFDGIKTLAGDDPETYRIFQTEGATQVTQRVAEGLVATGMLRDIPLTPPFDSRFVEVPTP
jgi:NitT/TauT family transport system substrate-binding protein